MGFILIGVVAGYAVRGSITFETAAEGESHLKNMNNDDDSIAMRYSMTGGSSKRPC